LAVIDFSTELSFALFGGPVGLWGKSPNIIDGCLLCLLLVLFGRDHGEHKLGRPLSVDSFCYLGPQASTHHAQGTENDASFLAFRQADEYEKLAAVAGSDGLDSYIMEHGVFQLSEGQGESPFYLPAELLRLPVLLSTQRVLEWERSVTGQPAMLHVVGLKPIIIVAPPAPSSVHY
jgi:hypothetical protein